MTRAVLRYAAELTLAFALIAAIAQCARHADATVIQAQVPAGKRPDVSVLGAELKPGAALFRVEYPGEAVCFALLVDGKMASTGALDCLDQRR